MVGCIPRWFTGLQTVTHPSNNCARCKGTSLIESKALVMCVRADSEFHFVPNDTKLQKLAPKVWKSKDCSVDEPLLTFHFRVQYYVDNIGLLKCVLPLFCIPSILRIYYFCHDCVVFPPAAK